MKTILCILLASVVSVLISLAVPPLFPNPATCAVVSFLCGIANGYLCFRLWKT